MAYVAVRGGQEAIEASLELLAWERTESGCSLEVKDLMAAFPNLIDQVMGESSLYAPELAALALKQAQGSCEEAVFLLRAFRSTLERPFISRIVEPSTMNVQRRISAAFKDIPGGQILGATRDYSHRLLDFNLLEENDETISEFRQAMLDKWNKEAKAEKPKQPASSTGKLPKVADYLRAEGLLPQHENDNALPCDVTLEPLVFPTKRSARLQTLTRGMTQAVNALGYAAIRGFGPAHPTVAELRYGTIEILIDHPLVTQDNVAEGLGSKAFEQTEAAGKETLKANDVSDSSDAYYLGSMPVTEAESLFETEIEKVDGSKELAFNLGYGMVMGREETKAIAMSVLDNCLMMGDKAFPTQDEEFVLYHVDGIEATGFISHLKLPHYVTFQSKLSSVRKTKEKREKTGGADEHSI